MIYLQKIKSTIKKYLEKKYIVTDKDPNQGRTFLIIFKYPGFVNLQNKYL